MCIRDRLLPTTSIKNASNSHIIKVPKSVGTKEISGTSGYRNSMPIISFDWQGIVYYHCDLIIVIFGLGGTVDHDAPDSNYGKQLQY